MIKLLFLALTASFILPCQAFSEVASSENKVLTKQEIEKKFNLPPEPDEKLNNATILGIDSNNNNIRDDWERAIAFEYYDDPLEMKLHNEFAKNSTFRIKSYLSNNINEYKELLKKLDEIIGCSSVLNKKSVLESGITDFEGNTFKRHKELLRIETEMSKLIGGSSRSIRVTPNNCEEFIK
tara:strand:- start:1244 stop:1786 length:543 start_codon:yes stop_codon:yes gene_type:complete